MKRVLVIVLCFFMAIATVNLNYATVNAVANENLKIPIKSISCGNLHNLVVKEDGSVWGWGYNADKQLLVDCYDKIISKPTQIPGLKDIVSVSAGMIRNTAITNEGTVYTWGGWGVKNAPKIASGLSDIVKVSSSKMSFIPGLPVEVIDYTLALDSKGKVFAWGDNRGGIFANGVKSYESIENPIMLEELDNIVDIAASHNLSFVLNNNGEVFVVGDRDDNYEDIKVTCDKVSQIGKITAIHANSKNDCFALANDGSVWKIYCSRTEIKVEQIEGLEDIATLYIGYDAYFAKDNKGQLYAWGLNNSYYSKLKALIGNGTIENVKVPIKLDTIDNVYCVSSGSQNTLFVTNDGKLYVCGSNTFGTLGYNNQSEYLVPTKLQSFKTAEKIVCLGLTTYFIDKDGKLYGTGANDKGVLGIENISELNMPRMIIKNIDTIADDSKPFSPVNNCYALDKDKNVWSWGGTANNALGRAVYNVGADGRWEFIYSDSNPAKIENLKNIKLIACDKRRGIAYDSSGNVWMWGGTKAGSTVKASIMYNEKGIVDINTGSPDWILKSNGTVYELMYDEVNSKYKMVQIDGLTDIIAIENHKALKKDGTVYTVKYDYSGSREKEPIVMPEMSNVRQIASCYDITLIIKNDGTLWSWKYDNGLEGIGAYKQFDEYEMEYPFIEAIQISNLTFESVDVGYGYAILKGTDGSYYGFGSGYNGQFGEGFEMGYISKPYELNHENWKSEK